MGSICRAMQNSGLSELVLVSPAENMDQVELRKMALKAYPIYEQSRRVDRLEEAVADCGLVAMTSGVDGFYKQHATSPRELAPELLDAAARAPAAIVFGPEDKGLGNDELKLATHLVRIPSHSAYSSLNLSQSVMLLAHELYVASGEFEGPKEATPPATFEAKERLFDAWDQCMQDVGFCPNDKRPHMMMGLRRIFSRGELSENDVKILLGLARQCSWAAGKGPEKRKIPGSS